MIIEAPRDSLPMKDYDSAVFALYGSYEKMRASPLFINCCNRLAYLNAVKKEVQITMDDQICKVKWWNLWDLLLVTIANKCGFPTFIKELDELVKRYEQQRSLPVGFFVKAADEDFDKFCQRWTKLLNSTEMGIYKND